MQKSFITAVKIFMAVIAVALSPAAFGVANYVYHERTGNDVTGGNVNTCGGPQVFLPLANPTSAQSNLLRFKVEYQFFTDSTAVYYTTDGSAPSGAKGVASGTTLVTNGAFQCTFTQGADTVDVWNGTIPELPVGTVVKYIIGAWHSGGGDEIFANSGTCGGCGNFNNSSLATVFQYTVGSATELYWDGNGAIAGAGAAPAGNWGTDNFWSVLSDGSAATGGWTAGRTAVFSAGADAGGAFTVTVTGTQTAGAMRVEEGVVSLAGGGAALGAGNLTVESGATLSTDSSLRLTATVGATATINGGTVRTTNPGAAGTFIDTDFAITLGPLGATFSHVTTNILNIVQTASVISGPGGLTKTGVGVLAFANANTYQGPTIINEGELRIRTSAHRLPTNTAVTVNSPGILNLNGVGQQIGSLSGNGEVGIGATILVVGDASSTVFSGAIKNIANAGAAGVTTGAGRIGKVGSGTLTLTGTNSFTGSINLTNGAITAAVGSILCDPTADVFLQGGTLNLENAAQTILSLGGNSGTLNLASGHALTVNPTITRVYSGTIIGPGSLTKTGPGLLTLAGNNTYGGGTTVSAGTLRAGNSAGSATGSGSVTVLAGGTFGGSGTIDGTVVVDGRIAPGASPGTLNTGSETWNGGGQYVWEVNDVAGGEGVSPGWDLINITGGLTINATEANKFAITITSLNETNGSGLVTNFSDTADYTWTILKTTTGISGFNPATINLNSLNFSNALGTGVFVLELANAGNDLVLRFVHPPAIATAPVGGSAACTSNFTFSATATGTEPLAYQWKHAGTNLPGANAASLTVVATAETAGAYVVEVSNAFGAAASAPVSLVVEDTTAPAIVCPSDVIACTGSLSTTVTFTVSATDVCDPSVAVVCTPASGSVFPLGTNAVACVATDDHGNTNECAFNVVVLQTTTANGPVASSVCPGNSITLSTVAAGTGPFTYRWLKGVTEMVNETNDSITITGASPASADTYSVEVTGVCNSVTNSAALTLLEVASATGPTNTTACVGGTVTLATTAAGAGPFTYQWRKGVDALLNETNSSLILAGVSAVNAGNYCVEVTGACSSVTNCADVTVIPLPSVSVNSVMICTGNSAILTATTDAASPTYLWSPGGETTASITVSPTSTAAYSVTVTDSTTTCSAGASGTVTVNPLPTVAVNSATNCAGTPAMLTATTDATTPTFLWSPGGETTSSITVSPGVTTTYSVTVTDGATTCSAGASGTVVILAVPTVSVNSTTNCAGTLSVLTATTDASTPTYLWSPGGATTASITVSPAVTTTYTVTISDGTTNCVASASGTVTVIPLANVSVNSATVCAGSSAILTATTDATSPTYSWSPGGATTASITVSPASNTTYTVTVTDGATACSATASGTVTVNQPPFLTVNSETVCAGGSATLIGGTDATSPTYLWSPGGETTASITVSPASTTTYSVTVTDTATTCSTTASATVTVRGFDTFASTGAIAINDLAAGSPYPAPIMVSGLTATVCRVTVSLNGLSHDFPDDIDIGLVGPNGEAVYLMSDVGNGFGVSGVNLTFDDFASGSLPNATQIVGGTFKPSNIGAKSDGNPDNFPAPAPTIRFLTNLSVFNGINPNGAWNLFVFDDELVDAGVIAGGWTLNISTLNPIADVGISQLDLPDPVAVGSNLTYTVVVTNLGPAAASNVLVSDAPPAGATLVSFSSSQGSCTLVSGTVWCALGSIAPNASATVTVVVSPTATGTLVNTASVQADEVDFVTANNSSTASTTVLNPPVITTGPLSQVVCAGTEVTFTVAATGDAPLSYQWYFGIDAISGATGTTLTIPNAQPAASGGYAVVVNNSVGATSASATLTVNPLPIVSVNSSTICVGQSAILTANNNAASPTYLWSPGGETTASITVSPATTTTYSVVVTDGATTCSSGASGTVTVNQLTTATPLTSVTNACPGTGVAFATTAGGTGPHTYVWRKNGVLLPDTGSSITFASVAASDAGTYCVEVTGACNTVTNCATLTVVTPPAITSQPQNQIRPMGNSATFSVTATGVAPLTYQWQRFGVDLPGETGTTLTIPNLTLAQNGEQYSVIVSNCAGATASAAATLTVSPIAGVSFDFDTPNQFTNMPYYLSFNDWINTQSGIIPSVHFEVPTGGTGPAPGSGALDLINGNNQDNTITFLPLTYDFSLGGKTLNASLMFRAKAPASNQRSTQIAFVTQTNLGVQDANPQAFMSVILQSTAQPALTYQLRLQHRRSTGSITEVTPSATTTTLTAGNWYKVTAQFANIKNVTADTFTVAASIQDMGALGNVPGAVMLSYTPTNIVNPDLVNQARMHFALRGFENTGVDFRDNLVINTATGPVFFVTPPATQTVLHGRRAVFQALVDGDGPYTYQWSKNGAPILGARSWKYITPPVTSSDSGAQYTCEVTGPANTVTSDPGVLTVAAEALDLVSVGSIDGGSIGVRFDQPVDPVTGLNPANYLINGQPATAARRYNSSLGTQGPDGIYVILTPASTLTGPYTVSAPGVQDLSGNPIGVNNSANGRVEGMVGVDINPLIIQPTGENYSFSPGGFEVTGSGVDIFGTADSFRYVYTQRTGDFDVIAQIPAMNLTRNPSKGGFEVRESLDPTGPQVLAAANPQFPARNFFEGTVRPSYNVATVGWGNNNTLQQPYPNAWLRLRRSGNTFLRYSSTNGVLWRFDGQVSQLMPNTVYLGLASCSVANANPHTVQFENYGEFAGYAGATIAITTQPIPSATVVAGSSTNLSVVATITGAPAAGELTYVWQRHAGAGVWTNVATAGQTNNIFNAGALFGADNGAEYRVVVRAAGAADVTSTSTTVTVTDAAGPTITAAVIPSGANAQVLINYSEPMAAASVLNPANYTVTNTAAANMGVSSVTFLGADLRTVLLTTASPLIGGTYGLRVSDVQDLAGNNLNPNPTLRALSQPGAAAPQLAPVVIQLYGYLTNSTTGISDLTNNNVAVFQSPSAKFAADTPDLVLYTNIFGFNPGFADTGLNHYGMKIFSYFVPATSGQYKFFLRADDFAQFLMNTNSANSTNPAGAVLQLSLAANNAAYTVANSVTNTLVGGQRYYIELRFKETTGGEGGTIAVRTDNTLPAATEVIPATQLAFPDAVAKPTPVVVELYTGQVTVNSMFKNDLGATALNGGYPDLLASSGTAAFIARNPNVIGYARYFGYNSNLTQTTSQPNGVANNTFDNYLGRLYGNFIAPSNGLYKFYIRADDSAELWLNTNAVNSTDPAGITLLGLVNDFYDVNQRLVAQNIYLNGGQRYFLEGRWREGTGGDGMTVAFRAQSDLALPPNTEMIPGTQLEFPVNFDRVGPVDGTLAPLNPTVTEGQTITFQAVALRGAPSYSVQWLKNGVQVQNNALTFVTQPLTASDNGAVFTMVVSNAFSRAERSTTVTVLDDNTLPTIVSAVGSQFQDYVVVTFSEPVDPGTAGTAANYQLNNGLGVLSATLDANSRTRVTLRTTLQTPGTTYTMTVNNVRDPGGNTIAGNTAAAFTAWIASGTGFYVEIFTNIAGTAVANLHADPKYLNNWPDAAYYTNRLGAGWFANDTGLNNYAVRVTGLFSPPTNGLYRFYIRGDDGTQLFMNTNGPSAAGRVLIARNDGANSGAFDNGTGGSASPILSLNANTLYFMEAFMKEGGGGDHLEVALRPIDPVSLTAVGGIPPVNVNELVNGALFVTMGNPDLAALTVAQAPASELTVAANDTVTLRAFAYASNFERSQATGYQWQRSDGTTFQNIPGEIGPTYTFIAPPTDTEYRLVASSPGTNAIYPIMVHSSADNKPPFMVSASSLNGTNLDVVFSEPVDISGADPFNYTVNQGVATILGIVQRENPRNVTITVDAPLSSPFTVEAFSITDLGGNFGDSVVTGRVSGAFVALDVGTPVAIGSTFNSGDGEMDVVAGGNDIWGTSDVGHLTLTPVTGNFDIHVRVAGLTRPDPVAKAGLMVRETLDANSRVLHTMLNPAQAQPFHPLNPQGLSARDLGEAGHRYATGQGTAAWAGRPESLALIQQTGGSAYAPTAVPNAWQRIRRQGNLFTALRSYDGVNWDIFGQCVFNYPRTVYVGFGTTAHTAAQAAGLVTVANYRDIYIPPAPIILVQPAPTSQTVALHSLVNYSVVASNPPPNVGPLTYQWYHNGIAVPDATGATLTIADAEGANSGVYHVEVSNDGGTVNSVAVTLDVDTGLVANTDAINTVQNTAVTVTTASLLANDTAAGGDTPNIVAVSGVFPATFATDFNSGLPLGAAVYGAAGGGFHDTTGGVDNSGVVKLTLNVNNHAGALVIAEQAPGRRVTAFNASFKLRIGDGSAEPADGFSFNFAPDLQDTANTGLGENGVGTGLSFCVDNYRFLPYPLNNNAIANTSGLKVRYRGLDVAGVRTITWNSPRFVPVNVSVTPEGMLTVLVDGTNVFGNVLLPNYIPLRGRFGMYARNGGQNMSQWVDDLSITSLLTVETTRQPAVNTTAAQAHGNAYIAGGLLHLTDNVNSQQGAWVADAFTGSTPLDSFTAAFTLRIGGGTAVAADGFSFNFANNLPNASFGEEGAGSGLTIAFDSYDNGGAEAPAFEIKWAGTNIATVFTPISQGPAGTRMIPVLVTMAADGTLDLSYDETNVFTNVQTPFTPMAGRFGFGGRTGGLNDNHWMDNLVIDTVTAGGPVAYANDFSTVPPSPYGTVVLSGGNVIYNPPANVCGTDTFYYLMTGQSGGIGIGRVDVTIAEGTPTAPTITACASNRVIAAGLNCLATLPDLRPEVLTSDNCCCPTVTQDPPPGTLLGRGVHTVTFTATDSAGLTAVCQATITVQDLIGPVIALVGGSGPISIECHSNSMIPGATAQDDCDGDLTSSIVVGGSVDRNVPGAYILTYNVSDLSGNAATQVERIVNVVDTSVPTITCPPNIAASCSTNGGAIVTYTVLASDVCDSNVTVICTPASGSLFAIGVTAVNCVATDASGNTNACSFTVTVNDNPALLTIERLGTNSVVLSWPQTCGQFILEQSDSLAPPAWGNAPGTPALVADRWTITLPSDVPSTRFYRLRQ